MADATAEEDAWEAAAAAADNGRGIQLQFVNVNNDEEFQQLLDTLGVNGLGPVSRLRAYVERLKADHPRHKRLLPSQISEKGAAALEEMAIEYASRKRTIVLSAASMSSKNALMDILNLPEKGADWENRAVDIQNVSMFSWLGSNEDSSENRQASLAYLKALLNLPDGWMLADVQPNQSLLSVEFLRESTDARKISGTTDIVIARSKHIVNDAIRNNIEVQIELKTPLNLQAKNHAPQAVVEHFAASYLNPNFPVVTVLTDLGASWTFFWFAQEINSGDVALYKIRLEGATAPAKAKYMLRSLFVPVPGSTLPEAFSGRISFQNVLDNIQTKKRARKDSKSYGDSGDEFGGGPTNGATDSPPSKGSRSSEPTHSSGTWNQKTSDMGHESDSAKGPPSMAEQLSLFVPPAQRDVANELDLLEMVDEAEQYEIIRSFASKYIVPYMRG